MKRSPRFLLSADGAGLHFFADRDIITTDMRQKRRFENHMEGTPVKKDNRAISFRGIMLLIAFGVLLFVVTQNLVSVGKFFVWLWGLIYPLVLGLCIAFVLNVVMRFFEVRAFAALGRSQRPFLRRVCRPLSLIVTVLSFAAAIALILLVIIPGIDETVDGLVNTVPTFAKNCLAWMTGVLEEHDISAQFIAELQVDWNNLFSTVFDLLKNGTGSIFDFTSSVFGGVANFFLGFILAIYILLQKEKISRFLHRVLRAFLPERATDKIEEIASLSYDTFSNFISGQLLEAVILGALCFVGMLIFGFPYAGVVSVLIAVTALIPIFGAWIGGGVSAFLILMVSPLKALLFLVFLLVLQQLENNLIYPRVVGKKVGLPAILVIIAVLIGGNLGGILTILISVPLCSVLYTLFRQYVDYRISRKTEAEQGSTPAVPLPKAERPEPQDKAPIASPVKNPPAAPTKKRKNKNQK